MIDHIEVSIYCSFCNPEYYTPLNFIFSHQCVRLTNEMTISRTIAEAAPCHLHNIIGENGQGTNAQ